MFAYIPIYIYINIYIYTHTCMDGLSMYGRELRVEVFGFPNMTVACKTPESIGGNISLRFSLKILG